MIMQYRKILEKFECKYYDLVQEFAEDLMSQISDEELLKIYETYPEIFSVLSQGELNIELIHGAIQAFLDFLKFKEDLENKLSKLKVSELKALAANAVQDNNSCTIKALIDFYNAVS